MSGEPVDVERLEAWTRWWGRGPLPRGATVLGVVTRSRGGPLGDRGALILLRSGRYVQGNAGAIRLLPQREVEAALGQ